MTDRTTKIEQSHVADDCPNQRLVSFPTAEELVKGCRTHPWRYDCGGCGEDVSRTAMVDLVYVFEICKCSAADYEHLVERMYHKSCYLKRNRGN